MDSKGGLFEILGEIKARPGKFIRPRRSQSDHCITNTAEPPTEIVTYHPTILVDTGLLVALYNSADPHHAQVVEFFAGCTSRLVTSEGCVTEVMWL